MRTPRMTAAPARSMALATLAAAATLATAAVAGCGSIAASGGGSGSPAAGRATGTAPATNSASTSNPAAAPSGSRAANASRTCASSALKVVLDTSAAGAAAGSSFVPLQFKNVSASSCTLPGFPAVSFATTAAGPQIGSAAVRQHSSKAAALILAPGQYAHAWLQILDAATFPASRCKPVVARGLRVAFTNAASAAFVPRSIPTCSLTQHGSNVLAVFPVQAGIASRGTAP